jgi:signal-transduction protein with cAMP-binding, CBS, and nucleotidyltransferase domain
MEQDAVLHMPVVRDGRVVGFIAKEDILRLLARTFFPEAAEAPPLPR